MIFRRPSDVDQGQYQCFAENKYGIATSNSVFVRKAYINEISQEDIKHLTGNEGEPFGIECNKPDGTKPESYPSSKIIWFVYYPESNVTTRILQNYSSRITVDPTGTLWFSNLTKQDGSKKFCYMCYAVLDHQNIYQEVSKYFVDVKQLNSTNKKIYYPPKKQYVSRNVAALAGDDVELFCIFGGTPMPKLSWHKDNAQVIIHSDHFTLLNNNRSLLIRNITIDDQSMYSCNVNSMYNAINVFVQEKPYFIIKPENIVTKENENVTIQCQAHGTPRPEIKWLYNGELITDTKIIINTNLIIQNVTKYNVGNYGCNATNSVGFIFQDVYLNIV